MAGGGVQQGGVAEGGAPVWKGQNISYSIENIQYYVLFNIIAGPEALLRQPLEDMKVF